MAAGLYDETQSVDSQFDRIQARIVDLQTGAFRPDMEPAGFDSRAATRDPDSRHEIAAAEDLGSIKARSRYMDVYLIFDDQELRQLILPVHGKGLWSTMYGFISLASDYTTINGFAFYEHGETPGLGGEIDNPNWKAQWIGKKIYDESDKVRIEVVKGKVDKNALTQITSRRPAGATLTARGVENLLRYWLGEDGYKPLITRLKSEGVTP